MSRGTKVVRIQAFEPILFDLSYFRKKAIEYDPQMFEMSRVSQKSLREEYNIFTGACNVMLASTVVYNFSIAVSLNLFYYFLHI